MFNAGMIETGSESWRQTHEFLNSLNLIVLHVFALNKIKDSIFDNFL